jgi:hypothetical protein
MHLASSPLPPAAHNYGSLVLQEEWQEQVRASDLGQEPEDSKVEFLSPVACEQEMSVRTFPLVGREDRLGWLEWEQVHMARRRVGMAQETQ